MISIKNLRMRFDAETDILYKDFTFESGKSYVILGASGCGKSTLLNMIAGTLTPTEGEIHMFGRDMACALQKEKDALRIAEIGYIFQDFKLIEEMTVRDNINILKLERVDTSRMEETLASLGMLKYINKRVSNLSGGEKQRVAIARALVKQPQLILADEPTGNLNYAVGRAVAEELIRAAKGKTLICVTHDDRLSPLFDVVIDMKDMILPGKAGGTDA
ncbi:MAG: ATP-binding cassette domain-containing protein [Clostridia bacterium]|nr:ATP-binding cassette domain-containing protein [Clostridia bacterium]